MPQDPETLAEAADHGTRHASDFAGVDEDAVLLSLIGSAHDGAESPSEAGDGRKAAPRDSKGKFTDGDPRPKGDEGAGKQKDKGLADADADLDAELDRLDAERGMPDDDGNPIEKKKDPEEEPETGEDPELLAARDELRRVHGLEDEDLEGLTPAQVQRRLAREQKAQGDIKALRAKLSAAGRGEKADPDDVDSDPDAKATAPDTASRRPESDDLDAIVSELRASFEEEFADGELAAKAADTVGKAMSKVRADADARYEQLNDQYDQIVHDSQISRLEQTYGRTLDDATRDQVIAEALTWGEVLAKRAGQDGPRDGRALMREAFDRAGREKLGMVPASRSKDEARTNGAPSPTGRRPSTDSTSPVARVKKMDEDQFLGATLDRIEAGDREGAAKLSRARRA